MVDEYLSLPEYYGPLPPGDALALRANPTVVSRLTGANAASVRARAKTATRAADLPPAGSSTRSSARFWGCRRDHALRRGAVPVLRARADLRSRRRASRTSPSRSTSRTGRRGCTRRTRRPGAGARGGHARPPRVGRDHGVPRGAVSRAGVAAGGCGARAARAVARAALRRRARRDYYRFRRGDENALLEQLQAFDPPPWGFAAIAYLPWIDPRARHARRRAAPAMSQSGSPPSRSVPRCARSSTSSRPSDDPASRDVLLRTCLRSDLSDVRNCGELSVRHEGVTPRRPHGQTQRAESC